MTTLVFGILSMVLAIVLAYTLPNSEASTFVEVLLLILAGVLLTNTFDRFYFLSKKGKEVQAQKDPESVSYASHNLVSHMKSAGRTDAEISQKIVDLSNKKYVYFGPWDFHQGPLLCLCSLTYLIIIYII